MNYWAGKTKDNKEVNEKTHRWNDIEKDLVELKLVIPSKNISISLPPNLRYTHFKSASSVMGSNKIEIESRVISFDLGMNSVKIRVDEKTNNVSIEVN
jgi:hypothetical protein